MKTLDISQIKNKFGRLLSYAHYQCALSDESINARVVNNRFFDFLEYNRVDSFLKTSLDDICFNELGGGIKRFDDQLSKEYIYAGESYITVAISLSIPLRKLFMLFPLQKMIELFPTYHEMGNFRLIEKVENELSSITTLKVLLERDKISVFNLSRALYINRYTLNKIKNNQKEEKILTYQETLDLSAFFNVDPIFFTSSQCVPYYASLWDDDLFVALFLTSVKLAVTDKYPLFYMDKPSKLNSYMLLTPSSLVFYSKGKIAKQLPEYKFDFLIDMTIKYYKDICFQQGKAYC